MEPWEEVQVGFDSILSLRYVAAAMSGEKGALGWVRMMARRRTQRINDLGDDLGQEETHWMLASGKIST
jgi:hypothetical protein